MGPILSADEVDDFIILRAGPFANKVHRLIRRDVLKDAGLSDLEWRMLHSVARFGSCHQKRISDETSLDPAHVSRTVAALEAKGFLNGKRDAFDNRRRMLSLTRSGRAKVEQVWPKARRITKAITDELEPEEFQRFKELLDRVNEIAGPMLDGALTDGAGDTKERRTVA